MVNPKCNALIGALPDSDYQLLTPHLRLVSLLAGQTIHEYGECINKIHFPIGTQIALSRDLGDGTRIDMALVGAEGMIGTRGLFGGKCLHDVYTAVSGLAYQIRIEDMRALLKQSAAVQHISMQAGIQLLKTISNEMVCSHFHCIKQRLARWLLTRQDQLGSHLIVATHQSIADSLGVRREAISNTFAKLEGVRVSRGLIELQDRASLERLCCSCYFEQKEEQHQQLLLPFHV